MKTREVKKYLGKRAMILFHNAKRYQGPGFIRETFEWLMPFEFVADKHDESIRYFHARRVHRIELLEGAADNEQD